MRARDQCTIFSTGGKFYPDYGLLLELHALTLVARSYALLWHVIADLYLLIIAECLSVRQLSCRLVSAGGYSAYLVYVCNICHL